MLNYARAKCVEKCDSGFFFESTGALNTSQSYVSSCQKCDEMLAATFTLLGTDKLENCATCSSLTLCLTC